MSNADRETTTTPPPFRDLGLAAPLLAALEGGFATHLVTTASLAKSLLAKKGAAEAA